jgi:hypothetical protein
MQSICPALYDDLLTIKTSLKELPLHHKIEFHHEVYNEKRNCFVLAGSFYILWKEGMKECHARSTKENIRTLFSQSYKWINQFLYLVKYLLKFPNRS